MLNSDSEHYGGSNAGNAGGREADQVAVHQHRYSLELTLPPLSCLIFKRDTE